jgi:hypothetical protein
MTLLGLTLKQLAIAFGAVGGAVTILYILKLRRRRVHVPFAKLWDRILKEKESTSLFRRLKRLLSLLLQLAFLFLLTAALGDPRLSAEVLEGRTVVLLLDASASMKAVDGEDGTRMQTARAKAKQIVRGMSGADTLMLVRMDAQVTPLSGFEGDEKALLKILEGVEASDTRADLARALKFCADALRERKNPQLVLIGDGAYPEAVLERVKLDEKSGKPAVAPEKGTARRGEGAPASAPAGQKRPGTGAPAPSQAKKVQEIDWIDLGGVTVRYLGVGKSSDNLGIVAFNARRYSRNKLSFEIFLEVVNYRDKPAEADLQILVDGQVADLQRISLKAGEKARYTCDPEEGKGSSGAKRKPWCQLAASGELLEARLQTPGATSDNPAALDAFPVDDRAYALLPKQRKQRILLVTRGNLYLEGALLLDDNLEVVKLRPDAYSAAEARKADAVVFDGFFPKEAPGRHFLILNPPEKGSPFPVAGQIKAPLITEHDAKHPVMRWVVLKDVNIAASARFTVEAGVQSLASSFRAPLIVAREEAGLKSVAIGFDITRSDLPLRIAFPILVINSLDWFSGHGESLIVSYRTGQTWPVPLGFVEEGAAPPAEVRVREPGGGELKLPVQDGKVFIFGATAGAYTITAPGPGGSEHKQVIAGNLADFDESRIKPRSALVLGGRTLEAPSGFGIALRREIWVYLLLAALGLILVEWLTYNRRITV